MTSKTTVDAARVELLLNELRLPGIKLMWAKLAEQSDKDGWPAARFLAAIAEHEMVDRGRRRMERHLTEARLPVGKTLATFDFDSVPMISKAQVMALATGNEWLATGANIMLFGPRHAERVRGTTRRQKPSQCGSWAGADRERSARIFRPHD